MTRRFYLLLIIGVLFVTFVPSLIRLVTSATDGVRQGYEQVEIGMRADQVRGIFSNDANFEDEWGEEEIIADWRSNEGKAVVVFDKNQFVIRKEWWRKDSGGFFAEVVMIITGGRRTGTPWILVHKSGKTGNDR